MEREGKVAEREISKKLLLVGKRGGPCTPPPTWRLHFSSPPPPPSSSSHPHNTQNHNFKTSASDPTHEFLLSPPANAGPSLSARKLCANLWEILPHHHHQPPLAESPKGGGDGGGARRSSRRERRSKEFEVTKQVVQPPCSRPYDQPANASVLRKDVVASPIEHHLSAQRNFQDQQSPSPTIDSSSMEVEPYKPAVNHSSSLELRRKINNSSCTLKTSTELLKVLNQIWSLEEQHASNMSLVRGLKVELDRSQAQIKKLLKQRQRDQQEMNELLKQVAEEKPGRKSKEMDRIKICLQSLREELEDERKLRKHSESLHQKLAREFSEMKSFYANALKQLESERKSRIILEKLCDEFAKGIQEYEQTVQSLKNEHKNIQLGLENLGPILHVSNAWLHERLQMNSSGARDDPLHKTIIEKLSPDIENFLQARNSVETRSSDRSPNFVKETPLRRHSLESLLLNEMVSAPRFTPDEYTPDSTKKYSDINKESSAKEGKIGSRQHGEGASVSRLEDMSNSCPLSKTVGSQDIAQGKNLSPLQVHVEKHRANASSYQENKLHSKDVERRIRKGKNRVTGDNSSTSQMHEETKNIVPEKKCTRDKTSNVLHEFTTTNPLPQEQENKFLETSRREVPCLQPVFRGRSSPVRPWISTLTPPHIDKSESLEKCSQNSVVDTLKAKLMEARLEGQRSRSKLSRASI